MKNSIQSLVTAVIILGAALLTCVEIPVDPSLNPANAKVKLSIKDGSAPQVNAGGSKAITLEVTYLQHLKNIRVVSTCGNLDTSISVDTTKYTDIIILNPLFTTAGECSIIATATMQNSEFKDRTDTLIMQVLASQAGNISFVKAPQSQVLFAGKKDTIVYITQATTGVITPLSYQLSVVPASGASFFTQEYSAQKDTVRIIASPVSPDSFTLSLTASSVFSGAPVSAIATTGIRVKSTIAPALVHAPEQLAAGEADTLRFAVDNRTRPDPLTIKMVTTAPLDPAIFTILPSGADSIIIAISPTAQPTARPTTIGIITSNGTISDTSFFPVSLVNKDEIPVSTDNAGPVILLVSGAKNGDRVKLATGTITCSITDSSGIDSALWTLNGVAAGLLTKQADGTFSLNYTLSTYGENMISIVATDKSPKHNKTTLPVKVVYNTVLSALTISLPAANATAVSTTPTFIWTGGTDADGDIVTSKVLYGETGTTLIQSIPEVTVQTTSVGASAALAANKTYYWQVISYTKPPYADTVLSAIASFTTAGTGIIITAQPVAPAALYTGDPLTLTVTASGSPEPTCQWYKDNVPLAGSTLTTLTKASVTAADNGVYYAVLKNGAGADVTTTPVTITVKTKVTITADPEAKTVNEGDRVTFTVAATGDAPLSYQWQAGTVAIPAGTSAILTIANATPADGGKSYSCIVSNGFSSATSKAALLTVSATPVYAVTFNTDGGSIVDPQQVKQGEKATRPADPTKQSHAFEGWLLSGTEFNFTTPITAVTALTAKWAKICTLSYNDNYADIHQAPQTQTCKEGLELKVAAPPSGMIKNDYKCIGWCLNWDCTTKYTGGEMIKMNESKVLSANWEKTKYTITLDPRGGTVSATTVKVDLTANPSVLPTPTKSGGYFFLGWFDAASNGTKITSFTKDQTLYAQWEKIECSARGNDVYICSGDGKTYRLSVTSNNSECVIVKYTWYVHRGPFILIPDPEYEGIFTYSGQGTNTLTVSNVKGGAYGFACMVSFEGGAQDTIMSNWSPDPGCTPQQ